MSDGSERVTARLDEIRQRLERITDGLRDGGTTDEEAGRLAAEAADLTAEAAREAAYVVEHLNRD